MARVVGYPDYVDPVHEDLKRSNKASLVAKNRYPPVSHPLKIAYFGGQIYRFHLKPGYVRRWFRTLK